MAYYDYQPHSSRDKRALDEKAWRRSLATDWDEKWHDLSLKARLAYLNQIKAPTRSDDRTQPSSPATAIDGPSLDELVAAGFARVEASAGKKPARVFPLPDAIDFSARLRAIQRYGLLGRTDRAQLINFVRHAFIDQGLPTINAVLLKAEIQDYSGLETGLEDYVTSRHWPGWAARQAGSPMALSLVDFLANAPGPVRLRDLLLKFTDKKGKGGTSALDDLIARLAVFEGLDPATLDIVVGLLPIVRQRLAEADKPRADPPLIVCEKPTEVGPASGLVTNDLRVFLLEVAGQPPRLRQDGRLFVKEEPRFLAALPDWPGWIYEVAGTEPEGRVEDAFDRARGFKFTETESDERASTLRLTAKGRAWLASELEDQYAAIYDDFRSIKKKSNPYSYDYSHGDSKFLGIGASVSSQKGKAITPYYSYRENKPEDRLALREAIHRAFAALKPGVFYRLASVLAHLAHGGRNPLLLDGGDATKLSIFLEERPVARLPERIEAAGRRLISALLSRRLVPFDTMRIALDGEGNVCVARLPRFEGYFGKPYEREETEGRAATRVIVQPDFSVIVIGLSPAPAAELAPFCDRASGQVGQGALTFKITRSSVIRAASQGLSADQIVARLKKHASVEVPANVLHEVRDWAGWIRLINVRPMTVVRCPDPESADRVVAALGRRAERLGETLVALDSSKVNPAERLKLQEQGVIITKDDITAARKPAPAPEPTPSSPLVAKRPRGRPKKVR